MAITITLLPSNVDGSGSNPRAGGGHSPRAADTRLFEPL